MKRRPDVLEWINKAEQDYDTAEVMSRRRKKPVPDIPFQRADESTWSRISLQFMSVQGFDIPERGRDGDHIGQHEPRLLRPVADEAVGRIID